MTPPVANSGVPRAPQTTPPTGDVLTVNGVRSLSEGSEGVYNLVLPGGLREGEVIQKIKVRVYEPAPDAAAPPPYKDIPMTTSLSFRLAAGEGDAGKTYSVYVSIDTDQRSYTTKFNVQLRPNPFTLPYFNPQTGPTDLQ